MSLITEFVQKLRETSSELDKKNNEMEKLSATLKDAAGVIEGLSAKLQPVLMEHPEQNGNNGWISCSERLPKEGEDVLIWYEYFKPGDHFNSYESCMIGYQYNGRWCNDVLGGNENDVKYWAWMPLPEPYKRN